MDLGLIFALQSINNQISSNYPSLFHSSPILPPLHLIHLPVSSQPSLHLCGPSLTFSLHATQICYWLNLGTGCTNTKINLGVKKERRREREACGGHGCVRPWSIPSFIPANRLLNKVPYCSSVCRGSVTIKTTKNDLPPSQTFGCGFYVSYLLSSSPFPLLHSEPSFFSFFSLKGPRSRPVHTESNECVWMRGPHVSWHSGIQLF